MKTTLALSLTLLLVGCSQTASQKALQQPPDPAMPVKAVAAPFVFSQSSFDQIDVQHQPRLTAQEVGTDIPLDVAPAHDCYYLKDSRPLPALEQGARYFHPAQSFVCLIPLNDPSVDDFGNAYPQLTDAALRLQKLLAARPIRLKPNDIPDMPLNNASQSVVSRTQYLDFPKHAGIMFLTQYAQEMQPNPVNNEEITYNFQGVTKDKRYYIAAKFAVTHPSLPKGIDFTRDIERDKQELYLRRAEKELNRWSAETFEPSLQELQEVIASISIK